MVTLDIGIKGIYLIGSMVTTLICFAFAAGYFRSKIMLKSDCKETGDKCREEMKTTLGGCKENLKSERSNLEKKIDELHALTINLHETQNKRMEGLVIKSNNRFDVANKDTKEILSTIGKLEGRITEHFRNT